VDWPTSYYQHGPKARKIDYNEKTGYEQEGMREIVEGNLNEGQRWAVERILERVNGEPKVFFLQGPGGTGKAFVDNYLLAKVRLEGMIALAVASSGIAALLLLGGNCAQQLQNPAEGDAWFQSADYQAVACGGAALEDIGDHMGW
jgi:hypothetical protein